jgi:SAM-dependent methyltransferase
VIYLQERLKHDKQARIRILEIGAGTGGTTRQVLQMLQPYQASIAEYCYSDVSEAFLHYGQQRYAAAHPYLTYQIFNVEKPLAGQGIEPGGYDLVIAANVLHATSDIRRSIRNAKTLLKRHGLLLLNELSRNSLSLHLTFGLLKGWWLYEDPVLRLPGCPLLAPDTWQAVLEQEGFRQIFLPTREADALGQQIIVAESNGIVRQQQAQPAIGALSKQSQCRSGACPLTLRLSEDKPQPFGIVATDSLLETLKHMASSLIGTPVKEINVKTELSEYGFDSITLTQFANHLNQSFQLELTPPLFYEHSTLDRLARYLQATYAAVLVPHFAGVSPDMVTRKDSSLVISGLPQGIAPTTPGMAGDITTAAHIN